MRWLQTAICFRGPTRGTPFVLLLVGLGPNLKGYEKRSRGFESETPGWNPLFWQRRPARIIRAHFPFRIGKSTACWIPIAGTLPTRAPIWMPDVSARGYVSLAESPSVSRFIFALLFVLCSGSRLMFHSPRFRDTCFVFRDV